MTTTSLVCSRLTGTLGAAITIKSDKAFSWIMNGALCWKSGGFLPQNRGNYHFGEWLIVACFGTSVKLLWMLKRNQGSTLNRFVVITIQGIQERVLEIPGGHRRSCRALRRFGGRTSIP